MLGHEGGRGTPKERGETPAAPGHLPTWPRSTEPRVCPQLLMRFVTPLSLVVHEAQLVALVGERAAVGMTTSEPPLRVT